MARGRKTAIPESGTGLMDFIMLPEFQERFWGKVNKSAPNGCWEWDKETPDGYGNVYVSRFHHGQRAHRIAYMMYVGEIPAGLVLDHLCRNRKCVNPAHLEAVTERVNLLRGIGVSAKNAAKTHCPKGHRFDDANTVFSTRKNGSSFRMCRQCSRDFDLKRSGARSKQKREDRRLSGFPLLLEKYDSPEGVQYIFTRGHHKADEFIHALSSALGINMTSDEVRQAYWRKVKFRSLSGFVFTAGGKRGSTPVTLVEVR